MAGLDCRKFYLSDGPRASRYELYSRVWGQEYVLKFHILKIHGLHLLPIVLRVV